MAKSKRKPRKYLEASSETRLIKTEFLDPRLARKLHLIFGFSNLDLKRSCFECVAGQGSSLLYILSTFRLFSQLMREQMDTFNPHCHPIPNDQIRKHSLEDLVTKAPSGRLQQLGRKRTTERIIGYYDSPQINVFQVCLLDLNHNLSG